MSNLDLNLRVVSNREAMIEQLNNYNRKYNLVNGRQTSSELKSGMSADFLVLSLTASEVRVDLRKHRCSPHSARLPHCLPLCLPLLVCINMPRLPVLRMSSDIIVLILVAAAEVVLRCFLFGVAFLQL